MAATPPPDTCRRVFVIGIGGCSAAGKSVLALFLSVRCGGHVVRIFHQDHYFRMQQALSFQCSASANKQQQQQPTHDTQQRGGQNEGGVPGSELTFSNIEHPGAIDFALLEREVRECKEMEERRAASEDEGGVLWPRIILVEGFLLFSSPTPHTPLHTQFDLSLFTSACYSTCAARRFARSRARGSMYQQHWFEAFFARLVWPAYRRYNRHVLQQLHLDECDAHLSPAELAESERQLPPFECTTPVPNLVRINSEDPTLHSFQRALHHVALLHPALAELEQSWKQVPSARPPLSTAAFSSTEDTTPLLIPSERSTVLRQVRASVLALQLQQMEAASDQRAQPADPVSNSSKRVEGGRLQARVQDLSAMSDLQLLSRMANDTRRKK